MPHMPEGADTPAEAAERHAEACAAARLDVAMVAAGLASSRNRAAREIRAGRVRVRGRTAHRPSERVVAGDRIDVESPDDWVARSAHKLLGALEDSGLTRAVRGAVCLDAGASTGGFTQVLLAHGAAAVHAVDVGHDQLAVRIAADRRVNDLSRTHVRDLTPAALAAPAPFHPDGTVDLVVADLSFISLTLVLDGLLSVCRDGALLGLMVKPQFELGRAALDKHGVVADPLDRARAVAGVVTALVSAGTVPLAASPSRLPGPAGNREAFVWARAESRAPMASVRSVSVGESSARSCGSLLGPDADSMIATAVGRE